MNLRDVKISITVDDKKLKTSLDSAGRTIDGAGKNIQASMDMMDVGKMVVGVKAWEAAIQGAWAAVKGSILDVVPAASAQETVFRSLDIQLKLNNISWKANKKSIDDFLASQQRLTVYGDTETAKALQMIMVYTDDLAQAMMGVKLAADMAASGLWSYETATRYVGLAMTGNVETLGEYIAELKGTTNPLLKTMDASERAAYAMDILNEKFGGTAQQQVETYAGKVDQLKDSLSDLKEAVGGPLLGPLSTLAEKLKEIAEWNKGTFAVQDAMRNNGLDYERGGPTSGVMPWSRMKATPIAAPITQPTVTYTVNGNTRAERFYLEQARRLNLMTPFVLPRTLPGGEAFSPGGKPSMMGFHSGGDQYEVFDEQLEKMGQRFEVFATDLNNEWSNTFYRTFTGDIRSIGDIWDGMLGGMYRSFVRTIADMAAEAATKQVLGGIAGYMEGSPGLSRYAGALRGAMSQQQTVNYVRIDAYSSDMLIRGLQEMDARGGTPKLGMF